MNLKKIFQKIVLISGFLFVIGVTPSLEVSATVMDDYTIPGQDALQEIVEEQEETVVIGGEDEQSEYSVPANKVAIEYNGKIDATTGESVVGDAVNVGEDYFILKRNELAYNVRKRQYHILAGDRGIYCNVPSDAVLSSGRTIQFTPEEGVSVEVYRNGKMVEDTRQTEFEEAGEYLITMHNHAEARERSVRIVILNEQVNDLKEFRLPQGFEYTEVSLDGVKKSLSYNNYYDFLEEGHYKLQWENSRIHQTFVTEFILDMTAPTLRLPEVRSGAAAGKVSFTDMEEGAYVRWIRDSKEEGRIEDPSEVLSKKGNYVMRVYDQAGNYTEYAFTLEGYFDVNAVLAILFVVALICGGFFYCRRLRRNMRVG